LVFGFVSLLPIKFLRLVLVRFPSRQQLGAESRTPNFVLLKGKRASDRECLAVSLKPRKRSSAIFSDSNEPPSPNRGMFPQYFPKKLVKTLPEYRLSEIDADKSSDGH
jgi:hypothetical protein